MHRHQIRLSDTVGCDLQAAHAPRGGYIEWMTAIPNAGRRRSTRFASGRPRERSATNHTRVPLSERGEVAMLAPIAHGDDAFRLVDSTGRDVGWVRPKTVGLG
jgi:hypothetical protein